jgi:hypothetical protein
MSTNQRIREIEALAMSYRRRWAALPAAALILMLAAGCAANTTSSSVADRGSPTVSQSGSGQGGTASGSAPSATPSSEQPGSPVPVPTITATGTPRAGGSDCANWPSGVPQRTLSVAFVPVEVLRCNLGSTTIPGKGVYLSATLQRATKNLGILVAALRNPSGHMRPGTICPALAMIPPQLVLVAGNGAMISPRIPVTGCGLTQNGVLSALNQLPWQTVSVRLLSKLPDVNFSVTAPATPSASAAVGTSGKENGIPQTAANS